MLNPVVEAYERSGGTFASGQRRVADDGDTRREGQNSVYEKSGVSRTSATRTAKGNIRHNFTDTPAKSHSDDVDSLRATLTLFHDT